MRVEKLGIIRLEGHTLSGNELRGLSSFVSWLAAISRCVPSLHLVLPVARKEPASGASYRLRTADKMLGLGDMRGFVRAYLALPIVLCRCVQLRISTKTVLCRAPEHLNALLLPLLFLLRFDVFVWIVHDRERVRIAELERRGGGRARLGSVISRLTGEVEKWSLRRCAGAIVNGGDLHSQALALGVPEQRLLRIVSATITEDAIPSAPPVVAQKPIVQLLYVGRISPEKGLEDLVDALAILGRFETSVRHELTVVGWSGHGEIERVKRRAELQEVSDRITFVGHVAYGEDLFELYRRADLFVLPSWVEGTPRVLVEAMAFGLPVVATNVGGIPDLVDDQNGFLVEPKRPEALAERVAELVMNIELRQSIANANWAKAASFVSDRVASEMAAFISDRSDAQDALKHAAPHRSGRRSHA